jgi:competence protein ComEA
MRDRIGAIVVGSVTRFGFSRLVGTTIGVVATAVGAWWVVRVPPVPVESNIPMATSVVQNTVPIDAAPSAGDPMVLTVHVAGEVVTPGVYELAPGSRMVDALVAAGGPTRRADTDAINLALPVSDAQQVYVPRKGATPRAAPSVQSATEAGAINLNTASVGELESLPGIGPQTAKAIVDHRSKNGPFLSVDELLGVRGIGPAKLEGLRERVRV